MNKWNEPHGISHTNAQKENETNNEPYIQQNILESTDKKTHLPSHIQTTFNFRQTPKPTLN